MTDQDRHGGAKLPEPDAVREEAQRLVAAGIAAVSMVADRIGAPTRERGGPAAAGFDALGDMLFGPSGQRRHSVANDSAECCRCPVCRVISAAREPDPNVARRLATGAATVAEGATKLLRAMAGATSATAATTGTGATGATSVTGATSGAGPVAAEPTEPAAPADVAAPAGDPWAAVSDGPAA